MYTFVTSTCLARTIGAQWKEEPHLDQVVVASIYQNFTKVYLTLTHPDLQGQVYADMEQLRAEYSSYQDTLEQLLIDLGERTLDTVPSLPDMHIKYAKYSDAIRAGYKVKTTIAGMNLPDNYPEGDKHDLEVTRPKYPTSMSLLHTHCLISVNGYYHMTETNGAKAFVMKGADTMRKSNLNHMGIWSFNDVGALEKIKINEDDIIPLDPQTTLRDKILFTVPDNLDNKSYILILGGYIVLPETNVFYRNGPNSFCLDIKQLPYLERIFESSLYIDLSSLGLTVIPNNPQHGFNVDEVFSDEVIKKYMTLSQSFLVLVDVPGLVSEKIFLRHASMPGMFTAYQDPMHPLLVGYGKVAEYWKTPESGFWAVSVQDSFMRNYIYSETPATVQEETTDNLKPGAPYLHSRGFLLQVSGYQTP